MTNITQTTRSIKGSEIERKWHVIDAKKAILGRMVSEITTLLQGKYKRAYVPYLDCGDNVVIINAAQVEITGNKRLQKEYDSYSGYPGGRKVRTFDELMKISPEKVIRNAVSGMLPKNKHRDQRLARLFVFNDEKHPHLDKVDSTKKES